MPASDYRDTIQQVSADWPGKYGSVPPELLEAIVQRESEGLATAQTGPATGLGQIIPAGMEYGLAVNDPKFVSKCGNAPNLYDPYCNLSIAAIGLAGRHDMGVESRQSGGYGSWSDWFPAVGGYFGAVQNEVDPNSQGDNGDGLNTWNQYYNYITDYLTQAFTPQSGNGKPVRSWKVYTKIDKEGQGAYDPLTNKYDHDALFWDSDGKGFIEGLVGIKDTVTGAVDSAGDVLGFVKKISGYIEGLIAFGPRLGFIVLGGVIIIGGIVLWST